MVDYLITENNLSDDLGFDYNILVKDTTVLAESRSAIVMCYVIIVVFRS